MTRNEQYIDTDYGETVLIKYHPREIEISTGEYDESGEFDAQDSVFICDTAIRRVIQVLINWSKE